MLADEVAAYLVSASLGLATSGSGCNLYAQPFPEATPTDLAASIETLPGRQADRTFGTGTGAPLGEYAQFVVLVRGAREASLAAEQLAHSIYKALDNLGPVSLSSVTYRDVRALHGPPWFLGYDAQKRPLYECAYEADKDRSA